MKGKVLQIVVWFWFGFGFGKETEGRQFLEGF